MNNFLYTLVAKGVSVSQTGIPNLSGDEIITNVLNLAYFIAGLTAVVVIIVAGIMYTSSAGDTGRITKAKNLLTYSVVGLVIVISAFAITNFVLGKF